MPLKKDTKHEKHKDRHAFCFFIWKNLVYLPKKKWILYNLYEMLLHLNNLIQSLCDRVLYFVQMLHKLHMFCNFVVLSCEVDSKLTSQALLQNTTGRNSPAGSGICDSVNGT